jgi:hypothetical protein
MAQAGGPPGRRRVAILLAGLLLLAIPARPAGAQDGKQGRLGHLAPLIGSSDYRPVLEDPAVQAALADLVGEALPEVIANLEVHGEIDFVQGHLVLLGNAPHQGTEEEATVWVRLYDGGVKVGLLHAGRFALYAREPDFAYLPRPLQDFFRPRTINPPADPPAGVVWVGRTR